LKGNGEFPLPIRSLRFRKSPAITNKKEGKSRHCLLLHQAAQDLGESRLDECLRPKEENKQGVITVLSEFTRRRKRGGKTHVLMTFIGRGLDPGWGAQKLKMIFRLKGLKELQKKKSVIVSKGAREGRRGVVPSAPSD